MNDRFVVRAVVLFLGIFALVGLGLTAWLIHDHVAAESVAVISGAMGVALGALGTLLASVKVSDAPDGEGAPAGVQGPLVPGLTGTPPGTWVSYTTGNHTPSPTTTPAAPAGDAAP